ncbi:unnamed protein product [Schistosoma turkestanicum]|nr:unnamed protein product [Schistosoma turkestanicum]
MDTSTPQYISLSKSFCDSIIEGIELGNQSLSTGVICNNVIFTPVTLSSRRRRETNTLDGVDLKTKQGVQGIANVTIPSPQAVELSVQSLTNIISSGISRSKKSSGVKLRNLETKNLSTEIRLRPRTCNLCIRICMYSLFSLKTL